jgi:hypothetical protein
VSAPLAKPGAAARYGLGESFSLSSCASMSGVPGFELAQRYFLLSS